MPQRCRRWAFHGLRRLVWHTSFNLHYFRPYFLTLFEFEISLVFSIFVFFAKNSIKTTSCALFSLRNDLYSFKFAQICNLNSYCAIIPFSPNNAANHHKRTYKGTSASFKSSSDRLLNSRKGKDTILICTASSFHLTFSTFPAFESHSPIIYLLLNYLV